jgi:outer membrane protein assembly factor BamB
LLSQQIEAALPRSLPVTEAPAPMQPPVRLSFSVSNPTAGVLWYRFRGRPLFVKVSPASLSLQPGGREEVKVEFDPGQVTRENYRSLEVTAAWSVIEKAGADGTAHTRNGEHRIPLESPPPRRIFACPDPKCAQVVLSGETRCRHCGALLQYCPECEAPALRTASVCNALARHPLPRSPDWPLVGGNAARVGAVARVFRPQASLAWKYAPPSPKTGTAIEWAAPVIAYNMVFVAGAVPGEWSRLIALELATGAELWQAPLPENDPVYPYRAGPSVANGSVYVATLNGYVLAVDAARGRARWTAHLPPPHRLFAGCLAAGNALFLGTALPEDPEGRLIALWPEDAARVWSMKLAGRLDTPLAAGQGKVYGCCDDGRVTAVRAADGQVIWEQASGGQFDGGPVLDGETLFCANAKGELMAFAAATGTPRWREELPAAVEAAPAVHGGRIYCGCADGSLYCYSLEGKRIGSAAIGAQVRAAPLPVANGALVGAEDGQLYFSDAIRQAVPLYQTEPGTRLSAPLAASGRRVVMSATNGTVYAVDVEAEE